MSVQYTVMVKSTQLVESLEYACLPESLKDTFLEKYTVHNEYIRLVVRKDGSAYLIPVDPGLEISKDWELLET